MNEFKSLESLVLGGSYLVGRPRRLYDTTSFNGCTGAVLVSSAAVSSAANEVLSGKLCVKYMMFFSVWKF